MLARKRIDQHSYFFGRRRDCSLMHVMDHAMNIPFFEVAVYTIRFHFRACWASLTGRFCSLRLPGGVGQLRCLFQQVGGGHNSGELSVQIHSSHPRQYSRGDLLTVRSDAVKRVGGIQGEEHPIAEVAPDSRGSLEAVLGGQSSTQAQEPGPGLRP